MYRIVLAIAALTAAPAVAGPSYHSAGSVTLGAPDRWDYVVSDAATGRVYVAHGDRLDVVDGRAGTVIGAVNGIPGGPHGTVIVRGVGVTDDGDAAQAVIFDPKTLAVLRRVPAGADADGIAADPVTGRVLVANGDPGTVSVIDPAMGKPVATIPVGEALEYPAAGKGRVFVAGKAKGDIVVIDPAKATVLAHWAMPDCVKPHGLAIDPAGHRLFVGCVNTKMIVLDSKTGRIVATMPIGQGSDSLGWDPRRRRVFSANGGDGTITVVQQDDPDHYHALEPIRTRLSGRNMAVDEATGRLFVAAGDATMDGGKRHLKPGSLALLMFDPN